MLEELKEEVWKANLDLVKHGLVVLTWGNTSGIDREKGLIVIKPSGVDYDKLTPADLVVIDLEGNVVEGDKRPSSDTPTHCVLYKAFPKIGGITHTHSNYATMFAQAGHEIPCFGTTHADHFHGPVPVTRLLTKEEVEEGYEENTGRIIADRFKWLDPVTVPGVLVSGHGPFAFGKNSGDSVKNALILERIAEMALGTIQLNPASTGIPGYMLEKHFQRKHGPDAYYGQKEDTSK